MLGAVVNYGINADTNQRAQMHAFRQALADAAPPVPPSILEHVGLPPQITNNFPSLTGGGNAIVTEDRYVPNPLNPFSTGTQLAVNASGSVLRDYQMHKSADVIWGGIELPRVQAKVNGLDVHCDPNAFAASIYPPGCKTASIREVWDPVASLDTIADPSQMLQPLFGVIPIPKVVNNPMWPGPIDWYEEIYGASNVRIYPGGFVELIDACDGEIVNYEACYRRARQIVDSQACLTECERGQWSIPSIVGTIQTLLSGGGSIIPKQAACPVICYTVPTLNLTLDIPWYARDAHKGDDGQWVFPHLRDAFAGSSRNMGLQPNTNRHAVQRNQLVTNNSSLAAQTTSTVGWTEQVDRTLVYNQPPWMRLGGVLSDGTPPPRQRRTIETTPKDQHTSETWTTPWEQ